jgi:hypothetical protein
MTPVVIDRAGSIVNAIAPVIASRAQPTADGAAGCRPVPTRGGFEVSPVTHAGDDSSEAAWAELATERDVEKLRSSPWTRR